MAMATEGVSPTFHALNFAYSFSASWHHSLHWAELDFGVSCHHTSLKRSRSLITIPTQFHSVRLTAQGLLPSVITFRASKMIKSY
jgi:hypothetical protein